MNKFPKFLQFTDEQFSNMTIAEFEIYRNKAKLFGLEDDFIQCMFEGLHRVTNNGKNQISAIVKYLEAQKRTLGRQYGKLKLKKAYTDKKFANTQQAEAKIGPLSVQLAEIRDQYNDLENKIQWLCSQYKVSRRSKVAYLL